MNIVESEYNGKPHVRCRMCESASLANFLNLGYSPLADAFLAAEDLRKPEVHYPLGVGVCTDCGLVQLDYVVNPEILYGDDYPYESSTTEHGRRHFFDLAASIKSNLNIADGALAVDIGSNVGVLLSGFRSVNIRVVGIEPVAKLAARANENGIETINRFFSQDVVEDLVGTVGKATVVTATNVFAHVDDTLSFTHNVKQLLSQEGVFVIEAPYFVDLVDNLEYDTIYHEHLSYFAMTPLVRFFNRCGLEVFDVKRVSIHGGGIQVYVGFPGKHAVTARVAELLTLEQRTGVLTLQTLSNFAERVSDNRTSLLSFLFKQKTQGKRLVGISAPAKGNTLLNYCKIGPELLDYVTEKAALKIGRFSPGMHIPVVQDERLMETKPDYGLLLAWNFRDEIMRNLSEFSRQGGKFVIPIPSVTVA